MDLWPPTLKPVLFLTGFLCAWLLWGLGWSEGGHLFELPANNPLRTHAQVAGALTMVGFLMAVIPKLLNGPRGVLPWLLGLTLGIGACGLLQPINASGPGPWILIALLPLLITRSKSQPPPSEGQAEPLPSLAEVLPIALGGVGFGLALSSIATPLTRMLPADRADQAMLAFTFLALTLLSLWLLGRWLGREVGERETSRILSCLGMGALICALSLRSTANLTRPSGLREVLGLVGLDVSDAGTWAFDLMIATVAFGPLALLAGCLLHLARRGRVFLALFFGTGIGVALKPFVVQACSNPEAGFASCWPTVCVIGGAIMALVGATWQPQRATISAATLGAVALWWFAPGPSPVLKAWERFAAQPEWTVEFSAGQIALTPGHEGRARVALDQRALTGANGRENIDALVLARSAEGLNLDPSGPRALLVGQLDLPRSLGLIQMGFNFADRTAFFHRAMPRLEQDLFEDVPQARIAGEILEPKNAWSRLQAGDYDLVVVPPIPERLALLPLEADFPAETRIMAWLDGGAPLGRLRLPERVLLLADGVFDLTLGVQLGGEERAEDWFTPGTRTMEPMGLERLLQRPSAWPDIYRAQLLERCAKGEASEARAKFLRAFAGILRGQEPSSPFESRAEAFEISDDQLTELVQAIHGGAQGRFVQETLFGVARVLVEKRHVQGIQTYLGPVSKAWGKPLELELALAAADCESLDAESALQHLKGLDESEPRVAALKEAAESLRATEGIQDGN